MKKFAGYVLLGLYLLISILCFARVIKPGASIFYLKEKMVSAQISGDSGFAYRYIPNGDAFEYVDPQQVILAEDGKWLERTDVHMVINSGGGRFAAGANNEDRGTIYFSTSDHSDPAQNGRSYTLAYPNPLFSPLIVAGGFFLVFTGMLELWRFLPTGLALVRQKQNPVSAFLDRAVSDAIRLYCRMRDDRNVYVRVCVAICAVLWGLTALRAGTTGITYDEAYTYLVYSGGPKGFLQVGLANNHPLNSFLVYLSATLTGIHYNELVIRLPSLLFYGLYLGIAVAFSLRFERKFLAFALLCGNYFLSEYFGLARGYGMAAALLLTGLFVYARGRKDGGSIVAAAYLFLLACAANFSLLVFLGCFLLYALIFDVKLPNLPRFLSRNWPHLLVQAGLAGLMGYAFLQATQDGRPLFGVRGTFFSVILAGFVKMFITHPLVVNIVGWVLIALYLFGVVRLRSAILSKPFTVLLAASLGLVMLLSAVSRRPLPAERLLLPFWPLVALSLVELYEAVWDTTRPVFRTLSNGIGLAVACVLMAHFFLSVNLTSTSDMKIYYPVRARVYETAIRSGELEPGKRSPVEQFYIEKIRYEQGIDVSPDE